jgi:hypothetical protein
MAAAENTYENTWRYTQYISDRALVLSIIAIYGLWVLATYLLEGLPNLVITIDPTARAIYVIVANVFIGTLLVGYMLRRGVGWGLFSREEIGFRCGLCILIAVALAIATGIFIYLLSGAVVFDIMLFLGYLLHVFPTSVAEVLVCWAMIGATTQAILARRGQILSLIGGIAAATFFFGIYHFAHSAPFNTIEMVLFLMLPGLATSIFYFAIKDIYATIIFQTFLGMIGVSRAVSVTQIDELLLLILLLALIALVALTVVDWMTGRALFRGALP